MEPPGVRVKRQGVTFMANGSAAAVAARAQLGVGDSSGERMVAALLGGPSGLSGVRCSKKGQDEA